MYGIRVKWESGTWGCRICPMLFIKKPGSPKHQPMLWTARPLTYQPFNFQLISKKLFQAQLFYFADRFQIIEFYFFI